MSNNIRLQPMYLVSGDPESENAPSLLYPGMIGGRLTVKEPGPPGNPGAEQYRFKSYQLVQTDSTMSVAPYQGAVAWWADKTKYLVTTSPTKLGQGRLAGVFKNAITPGNFGCIQIEGPSIVKFIDTPTSTPDATGKLVVPSSTAGKADCMAIGGNPGTLGGLPSLGVTAGALIGGTGTAVVDLDVPDTP